VNTSDTSVDWDQLAWSARTATRQCIFSALVAIAAVIGFFVVVGIWLSHSGNTEHPGNYAQLVVAGMYLVVAMAASACWIGFAVRANNREQQLSDLPSGDPTVALHTPQT
jgi:hypothetical protein